MSGLSADALAAAASNLLSLDPPPTEADIDLTIARMTAAFGAGPETAAEARRLLHARFAIRMDLGGTLEGSDEHQPWLEGRRASIDPFYWTRYRELLVRGGWSPLVAATLDRSTDELLNLLGDPIGTAPWNRRGLVVGDVQSGKTASYAALICKAADAGYRMIILLTGTLENVRRQTQERLDAAFIGLDSRDLLTTAQVHRKRQVGVGQIDGRRDGIVFTSRDHDFRKNAASALNISLASVNEPVLVVTKKNKAILGRLARWLSERNARDGIIEVPLLLIDDEADNASINTRNSPDETTAINKAIRDLLRLFRQSSYVGFTATPFANIFIDPSSTSDMLGDDLFPRDFIHVLEPPTNYVGMQRIFPIGDPEQAVSDDLSGWVRDMDDIDDWLPAGHKKEAKPGPIPKSLRRALDCFLLACAIRDLRAAANAPGRGGGVHRSMLVNVSRFTAVQNRVADALQVELEAIRAAVRLYGRKTPKQAAAESRDIATLATSFEAEFASCGFVWPEVLAALHEAIGPVKVQPVNQGTGAASLDYGVTDQPPGVRVIAVGGNSLSRGLTLEGLSTSYFLRTAKAYDTLLQMGRWFGYRGGYDDLCRLWLTDEADGWYRHVAEATAELKRDFARMRRRKATPREFGLRVRTHPDTLIITARNKMASGVEVVERDISLISRMAESTRLYSDTRRNQENFQQVDRFLAGLVTSHGWPETSPHKGAVLWQHVPATEVADFLDGFGVHPLNHDFQADNIAAFLHTAAREGNTLLSSWTVALLTEGVAGRVDLPSVPNLPVRTKLRRIKVTREEGSLQVSEKGSRVGSLADVRHGLSIEEVKKVRDATAAKGPNPASADDYRAEMERPLLLIYLLRGYERQPGDSTDRSRFHDGPNKEQYRQGLVLSALALHFPGNTTTPDSPRNLVRYRLNLVAQAEFMPADTEEDDIGPDDADLDD